MIEVVHDGPADRFPYLTAREQTILEFASEGLTNIQIGEKLNISRHTVAQHMAKMLKRAGATNRTDLVNRAHRAGILARQFPSRSRYDSDLLCCPAWLRDLSLRVVRIAA